MRQSIVLLVVILLAVTLYTAYGLMTFQPDEAKPFVFAEPVLPPELREPASEEAPPMSAAQQQQRDAAMAQLSQAISRYEGYEKSAPAQAVSTFALLNRAIVNGQLPAYLPSQSKDDTRLRKFELITLDPLKSAAIQPGESVLTCQAGGLDVLIGDNGDNQLACDAQTPAGSSLDRVFLGGPGADEIVSGHGNRIVNAGTGNDTIAAGPGRTIILLEDAWGQDILTVDCAGSKVEIPGDLPSGFPIPWVQPFTNFIVLSPRINPADVAWNGLVLTNRTTGDTLTVNENCFNLVSAGQ